MPWKRNHPTFRNNKNGSLAGLSNLLWKLQRHPALFQEYDEKIKEQIAEEIVEEAALTTTSEDFCIPQKLAVKQSAKTTKLRILHDASAKPRKTGPSLNEYLEVGPVLQSTL